MSKSKNTLPSLASLLTGRTSSSKTAMPSIGGSSASSPEIKTNTTGTAAPGADTNLRAESLNAKTATGIDFGKPSSNRTSTSATSELSSLLKSTENGAISSALGGGGLLGGLTGLGSLSSILGGLFGGGTKTLPPLTLFTLPQASSESFSIGTSSKTTAVSSTTQQGPGIYAAPVNQSVSAVSVPGTSSGQIAQVVKTALLNSSSLNDVINEI